MTMICVKTCSLSSARAGLPADGGPAAGLSDDGGRQEPAAGSSWDQEPRRWILERMVTGNILRLFLNEKSICNLWFFFVCWFILFVLQLCGLMLLLRSRYVFLRTAMLWNLMSCILIYISVWSHVYGTSAWANVRLINCLWIIASVGGLIVSLWIFLLYLRQNII